jgi:membrane-associated phospholipid phosphatase
MTRRPSVLLLASLGCGMAAAAVWAISFHVPAFSRVDSAVMDGFHGLERPRTVGPATAVSGLMDPLPFALLGATLIAVAALRGGARLALAVAAILVGANVTTQALKPLLETWETGHALASRPLPPGSWPSGHTTAAMSLALCLVLVVPARRRPVVGAAGGLVVVAVVFSILVLGWHYPSDVVGGFLVAAVWGLAALAVLGPARAAESSPQRGVALVWPVAAAAAALTALCVGAVLARPDRAIAYAQAHSAFVVGAAAVAAAGLAVAAGVAALARS